MLKVPPVSAARRAHLSRYVFTVFIRNMIDTVPSETHAFDGLNLGVAQITARPTDGGRLKVRRFKSDMRFEKVLQPGSASKRFMWRCTSNTNQHRRGCCLSASSVDFLWCHFEIFSERDVHDSNAGHVASQQTFQTFCCISLWRGTFEQKTEPSFSCSQNVTAWKKTVNNENAIYLHYWSEIFSKMSRNKQWSKKRTSRAV